jgi:hypothetical protein
MFLNNVVLLCFFSKHKFCDRASVIREIEICRVAVLTVNRYTNEPEVCFRRAEELRRRSRWAAIWRRITGAIEQPTDRTGPLN